MLGNYKFAELFDHGAGAPEPGMSYEEIIRSAVERGLIADARGRGAGWLRQRLAQHQNPTEPLLEHRADGTWLQVNERRIASGGSVAVYSDLTDIKESEQRAAAANQLILQSLRYASRIQAAILPAREELAAVTADHFLIWEPRDIVGGDFFWFQPIDDGYAIIVGDCTGHGVPGAFMTLIAWGMLDRMLTRAPSSNPSQVLDRPASRRAKPARPGSGSGRDRRWARGRGVLHQRRQAGDDIRRRPLLAVEGRSDGRHRDQGRPQGARLPPLPAGDPLHGFHPAARFQRCLLPHHRRSHRPDRRSARPLLRQAAVPEPAQAQSGGADGGAGRGAEAIVREAIRASN